MKWLFISIFKLYKRFISPSLPATCRYTPSCSNYGIEAVMKHGALKGVVMTSWRILRCNPFSKGGFDPVPINFRGQAKWIL